MQQKLEMAKFDGFFTVSYGQSRNQDFAKVGAFFEAWNNSEQTWLKLSSVLNQIETFFCPKSGDLKKKKVFTENQRVFLPKIRWSPKKKGLHVHWGPLPLVDIISGCYFRL